MTEEEPLNTLELKLLPQKIDAIHRSVLSGLLSHIATRGSSKENPNEYVAARGGKAHIFPGSGLFKHKPAWIMAAELVETTRLYARTVAPIQPQWAERLGEHLVQRTHTEPHWQAQSAHVAAFERVTLFGLTLVARRSVHYGPIDPEISRQLFIYHALVLGEYRTQAEFFQHNRRLTDEIRALEAKHRRRDLLVEDQAIYDFFDRRVPQGIHNGPLFEKWRQHTERGRPTLLFLQRRDLLLREVEENKQAYPDALRVDEMELPLEYVFDPSSVSDGVKVTVPLAALNQLPAGAFEWLVPGLLREKVIALMKTMPKPLRVKFVPIPDHADMAIALLDRAQPSLHDALARSLGKMSGEPIDREAFAAHELPAYLLMNFRVIDDSGEVALVGRNLDAIRKKLGIEARKTFLSQPPGEFHRDGITSWDFPDDLPERVEVRRNAMTLQGYPALVDAGESVSLRLFDSPEAARAANRGGVRRLLMMQLRPEVRYLSRQLSVAGGIERMCLHYATVGSCEKLRADLVDATIDRALYDPDGDIRTRERFLERAQTGWRRMSVASREIADLVAQTLDKYHALNLQLQQVAPPALIASYQDMRRHLASLVYDGFIIRTPPDWRKHYPRFLSGIEVRLRKLRSAGLKRDEAAMADIAPLEKQYRDRRDKHVREGVEHDAELELYRWMLEELRVSLFAQELKTSVPVSPRRLEAQWAKVRA